MCVLERLFNKLLNQQLDRSAELADKYSASYRTAQAAKQAATDMAALEVGRANGTISDAVYKEIVKSLEMDKFNVEKLEKTPQSWGAL